MGRSFFVVSSVAILASFMIIGNDASHHELCLNQTVQFTEIEYIALGECIKEYAPPPKLEEGVTESPDSIRERIKKARENKCMEPCFMNHKKMFVDGKLDMAAALKFIDEFPAEARPALTESLKKCAEPIKDKTLTMDNDCKDYHEFDKCVDDDENKICKRED